MAVDEQLRATALESLSAIVIGLLLCLAAVLASGSLGGSQTGSVTVDGTTSWTADDVESGPRLAIREDSLVIEWQDTAGAPHRELRPAPHGLIRPGHGRPSMVTSIPASLVAFVGSIWAFGEWIHTSRTPYLPRVRPQRMLSVPT